MTIVPVILGGGSGTRLWPLSREEYPKQFHALIEQVTMLQATADRLKQLETDPLLLVGNEKHRFLAAEQLVQCGWESAQIILEPSSRNTAPAIAIAAIHSMRQGGDPVLLVLAADHYFSRVDQFHDAVMNAVRLAESGKIVTFGIEPTHPETGYGYIKCEETNVSHFAVESFTEKPDLDTAKSYLQSGNYYWNSGMFAFRASRYLAELERYRPVMEACCRDAMATATLDHPFVRIDRKAFALCESESIDHAIMENTRDAVMVPLDAGWDDIGSWSALWAVAARDTNGNALLGEVVAHDVRNCLVRSEDRLVAVAGVEDLVVVETKDAVLVTHRDRAQDVKALVDVIRQGGRREVLHHRETLGTP